jgi:hypothetical protein
MLALTTAQTQRAFCILISLHILIIAASNYLVQIPFQLFGLITTWGTFSFPFIFLATDLTVRVFGAAEARRIVFTAMLPALFISYCVSVLFSKGDFQGFISLSAINIFVLRIAFASFIAYALGQLADILVFSRLRKSTRWWLAPASSTIAGNFLDTIIFFAIAFWASEDGYMALHWPEIAAVDYGFKIIVSLLLFLPLYGVVLHLLTERILSGPQRNITAVSANVGD